MKFEVLFDLGAYAILDGYYREAVSSFTSSLERFYEFFVRACSIENGCPNDQLLAFWKDVAQQSERQLGAYIFTYLHAFKEAPPVLTNQDTKFRNEVVHRGRIPTRDQATEYGQRILNIVQPALRKALKTFPKGVDQLRLEHVMQGQLDASLKTATLTINTIISVTRVEDVTASLHDKLVQLADVRKKFAQISG